MKRSSLSFTVGILLICSLMAAKQDVHAQGLTLPAEMNQAFTPISIPVGGVSSLRVSIFNPNEFPLTNASWTNNLIGEQPGLEIASPVGLINTCGGTVTAVAGGTSFSLRGGTVPAQTGTTPGSCTVSINVTSGTVGNLINIIPAGALTASGGGATITNTSPASATLHVGGGQPPSVRKSFSESTIWAGEISRLSIVISNPAPDTSLTQVSLRDDLPVGILLANPVSPTLSGCGASASLTAVSGGSSVTLNNGTITPGSTCTIRVNVISNVQGTYTNEIPVNALQTREGLTNVTEATARLHVQEIDVSKRFSPVSFPSGATTTLIITLENPTGSAYTGVSVSDSLPAPLTIVGVLANSCGGTVSTTTDTISLVDGIIPPGSPASPGSCTISVEVMAPAGTATGTFTNTIRAGDLTTDQGIGNLLNEYATVSVTTTEVVGRKSFSPSTIAVGENARLMIDIFAPSDTDLTNVSITDDLPAGITVSNSQPPSVSGCGPTPPLVFSAPTGASSVSLTQGAIGAGERCRIEIYVTGTAQGTHTNTISPADVTNDQNRTLAANLTSSLTVMNGRRAIALVKGFEPLTVFGGSASTMRIELINPGTAALSGIGFTDNMPDGMILANPVNFNVGTCGGTLIGTPGSRSFSYQGGSLSPGERCIMTLSATMTVNGNLTNMIPAGAVTTDNGLLNAEPAEASLTNLPGVSLSKYFQPRSIPVGSYSALTITVQNTSNAALSGLGFRDLLPAGLSIAGEGAPAPVNNCGGALTAASGTRLIELAEGLIDANASCSIVVRITGEEEGEYTNTIPAGAIVTDSDIPVTNSLPATDTLVITDASEGGGGGGGSPPVTATADFLIPVTGFAPGRVTRLEASSQPAYDSTSLIIDIPVLNVKASIVGVEASKTGWDVSWLQGQVGWLHRSAYPTWKGNSVLTAHAVGADGKPDVFFRLKHLGIDEYVYLYSSGYRYTYQVVSNDLVDPDDRRVMRHEEESYLTLVTCDRYDEKTGTYLQRVAVRAVLVDVRPMK